MQFIASIFSSLLFIATFSYYCYRVYKGTVRVSVSTFCVLTITSVSQAIALTIAGSLYAAVFMSIGSVVNFLIVFFALRRKNFEFKMLDKISFAAALVGIVVWYITKNPKLDVYILTLAIFISITPAVVKTFKDPYSEDLLAWYLTFLASLVFLCTITSFQPIHWIVQARQMVFVTLMSVAVSRRFTRLKLKQP